MDIVTLFFVFLVIAVVGIAGAIINMAMAMNNPDRVAMGGMAVRHMLFALFWIVGGLGAFITGIIWVVQQFS